MKRIGLPADESGSNARYYALIDVYELAKKTYGEEFSAWLAHSFEEIDFLYKLTQQEGVVLMYGPGFSAPAGTLRDSLANLPNQAYIEIGHRILELLKNYHEAFSNRQR